MRNILPVIVLAALGVASPVLSADTSNLRALTGAEIEKALVGKSFSYTPPHSADTGMTEAFEAGGIWSGIHYGRAPFPFRGTWKIEHDQLCVSDAPPPTRCRTVWQNKETKALFMLNVKYGDELGMGLQELRPSGPAG